MITPYWHMWDFGDIEIDLRDYARKIDAPYDPKHPLSILPNDAAKKALIAAGSNYEEIAKYMPADKKTVSGWFRPGRNPGRETVARNIVPAICEAYLRHNEDDSLRFHFDRVGYIYEGEQPSKAYLQMVQHRAFLLLTTGNKLTSDDRAYALKRQVDAYYKEVLRFAAGSLRGNELEDLSRAALHVLKSHVATTVVSTGSSDWLSWNVKENAWIFYASDRADLKEAESGGTVKLEELLYNAVNELESAATLMRLNEMSDAELRSLSALAEQIIESRLSEQTEVAKQLYEEGFYDTDEDDDVWNH